jgi:hypothetical protein
MYDRAAVSNRRIDPSNGFGPLGAVVTLHLRHKRQQNKSVVQLNMSRQHCQTNSHFKSCTVGVDQNRGSPSNVYM